MSTNTTLPTKFVFGAAVAGTITAASLAYLYRKRWNEVPPTKWKRVGEIIDINCFPIKSCAPVKKKTLHCNFLGLEDGNLRDRVFMVITPEGQFVTARTHPKMVLIKPNIVGDTLILSAPGKEDIKIDFNYLRSQSPSKAYVWQQGVNSIDTGDEVAYWLSTFVLEEDIGLRLVFYPDAVPTRAVRPNNIKFKNLSNADTGALHDATSYMIINQASMDELNSHLDHIVKPLQFRPNFVVKGSIAYEEDNWKWVRIGDEVVFKVIKPCTRCIFTNINPETALRNPQREPLKTLKENRSILPNDPPVMGAHLGLRIPGKVSIGDILYIEDE